MGTTSIPGKNQKLIMDTITKYPDAVSKQIEEILLPHHMRNNDFDRAIGALIRKEVIICIMTDKGRKYVLTTPILPDPTITKSQHIIMTDLLKKTLYYDEILEIYTQKLHIREEGVRSALKMLRDKGYVDFGRRGKKSPVSITEQGRYAMGRPE